MARVRKSFAQPDQARREARWLAQAGHPGVVRLVGQCGDHLDTELVIGPTLRTATCTPSEAAAVLASVARTLADLHQRGLVHGNIDPDHVIVAAGDTAGTTGRLPRTRLCSPKGHSPLDPHPDRARHDGSPWTGCPDNAGLRACLRWLIDDWVRRRIAVPRVWIDLAASVDAHDRQLTMLRLLRRIEALGPSPEPAPPTLSDQPPATTSRRRSRRRRSTGILALSGAVGAALSGLLIAGTGVPDGPTDRTPVALDSSGIGRPIDLDGARYDIEQDSGRHLLVAEVVRPCPGQPRLLALEVETGVVWAFPRVGDRADAVAFGRVEGATDLAIEPGVEQGACPRLWATGPAGRAELSGAAQP